MRIYLAGPMRGIPNFNFPMFDRATAALRAEGHEVFSPAERDRVVYGAAIVNNPTGDEALLPIGCTIRECMRADTDWICRHAEVIAVLPGWENSSGATAEVALGKAIHIKIWVLDDTYLRAPAQAHATCEEPRLRRLLTTLTSAQRKEYPISTGVIDYFPDALAAVAHVSWRGNQQHNPGEPLHWARGKSRDHADTIIRHHIEAGTVDTDGERHSAKRAWRALADLQQELELDLDLSLPRGCTE